MDNSFHLPPSSPTYRTISTRRPEYTLKVAALRRTELWSIEVLRMMKIIHNLGDLCKSVRKREGKGWERRKTKQPGYACEQMQVHTCAVQAAERFELMSDDFRQSDVNCKVVRKGPGSASMILAASNWSCGAP